MSLSKIVKDSILSGPVIDDDKSYNSIKSILEELPTKFNYFFNRSFDSKFRIKFMKIVIDKFNKDGSKSIVELLEFYFSKINKLILKYTTILTLNTFELANSNRSQLKMLNIQLSFN